MRVNDGDWCLLYPNNNSVPAKSSGEYTNLSYCSGFLGVEYQYSLGYTTQNLSTGDTVDFQVQAMVGNITRVSNPNFTSQLDMYPYVFTGESSDWSNIQTISIPNELLSSSSSQNPAASPDLAQNTTWLDITSGWVEIAMLTSLSVIATLLVTIIMLTRKKRHA